MADFTIYDALIGELEPYSPSPATLRKCLFDAGFDDTSQEYTQSDKKGVAKAAISVLKKLIVLSSDSLGKSSQGYQVDKLEKRIKDIAAENGLEVDEFVDVPTVSDGSDLW